MGLSVCIVNWNTKELLGKCIDSIMEKTKGLDYEVVVLDNDSNDGTYEMVENVYPACKIIQNASGQYILYLNLDTELRTNALSGML